MGPFTVTKNKPEEQTNHKVIPFVRYEKLVLPKKNGDIRKLIDTFVAELQALKTKPLEPEGKVERLVDKCLDICSKPQALWGQTAALVTYIGINTLSFMGIFRFDPYPYMFLNTLFSIVSGFTTVIVLNSNRRQDELAKQDAALQVKGLEMTLRLLESIDSKLAQKESDILKASKEL